MSGPLATTVARLLAAKEPVVLVTVAGAEGSTPREAGARMAVTAAQTHGTIGGGRMEWEAIRRARAMLAEGLTEDSLDLPLGPAVGQCCGGRVVLDLARADAAGLAALRSVERAEHGRAPQVMVFGAGHVGRALVRALAALPMRIVWSDTRRDAFPVAPGDAVQIDGADPVEVVRRAEPGAAVVVFTHSHAIDYAIAEAALGRSDLAYVGLIGSRTKRRRFERWFAARGGDVRALARLVCPIGDFGIPDKRPEVIAALTATEIVTTLARAQMPRETAAAARKTEGQSDD